jgi:hypothetical protein
LFEDAEKIFGWDWIMGSTALIFSLPLKVCRRYRKVRTVYSSKLYDGKLYIIKDYFIKNIRVTGSLNL